METGEQIKKLESAARGRSPKAGRDIASVLLVEGDPDLQWNLARMLTVNGNRVVGTSSGDGAMAVIEHWSADLALVSSSLPDVSGSRGGPAAPKHRTPTLVVILMDDGLPEPQAEEASTAVAARLPKPFRFEALRALLESSCNLHRPPRSSPARLSRP